MKPVTRTRILFATYDLFLVVLCMLVTAYLHDGLSFKNRGDAYLYAFLFFPFFWLLLSLITRKFRIGERTNQKEVFISVIFSNFIILSVTTIIMVMFQQTYFSRFIFFGAIASITLFEVIAGAIYVSIQRSVFLKDWIGLEIPEEQSRNISPVQPAEVFLIPKDSVVLRESIIEEAGEDAFKWIREKLDIADPKNLIFSTDTRFNIINHPAGFFTGMVNLERINNFRRINKFFETVNSKLPQNGIFIGCVETYLLRKQRILAKFPPVINYLVYTVDFFLYRVFPKLVLTRKMYFFITRGKKRVMSRTEAIGRLYSCGFELEEERIIGSLLYWKSRKTGIPSFDSAPSYGVFVRLLRIGKNGKEFKVYKLRTMHAYAEYIQRYVYENNHLDEGGKFKDDFRVTTLGRFLRKLWLDELPMLINVLKGDMKIVGVRPLSRHYFSLYSAELQQKRTEKKPGLIPPFYAQYPTPVSLEEVQKNEMEYLLKYEKKPFSTDVQYFFRAMYHIIWHRSRSK